MKKVKKQVWLTAGALAVAGNLYLIYKEDSKALRSEWLSDWDRAKTGDVVQAFSVEGVVVPSDNYPIYFDERKGALEQVYVQKGDAIQPGTPLFEYSSAAIDDEITRLNAEKEETEQTVLLIENQLSQLQVLLSQAESNALDVDLLDPDELSEDTGLDENTLTVIESGNASAAIENEILRQETEKQKLQEQVRKFDTLIAAEEAKKSDLIVQSANEGYVQEIDTTLNNPLLIISSSVPAVEGLFDEKQLDQAESGQRVEVTVDTTLEQFDGVLGTVSTYPEEAPSVKRPSLYPFSAQLTGVESADLHAGLKAHVKVVTEEVPDAVVVPHEALWKQNNITYGIVLNTQGQLERRELATGLHVDGTYAVTGGVEAGEAIVINPHELAVKKGPFITPVQANQIQKRTWNELSRTEKLKYTVMGFLS